MPRPAPARPDRRGCRRSVRASSRRLVRRRSRRSHRLGFGGGGGARCGGGKLASSRAPPARPRPRLVATLPTVSIRVAEAAAPGHTTRRSSCPRRGFAWSLSTPGCSPVLRDHHRGAQYQVQLPGAWPHRRSNSTRTPATGQRVRDHQVNEGRLTVRQSGHRVEQRLGDADRASDRFQATLDDRLVLADGPGPHRISRGSLADQGRRVRTSPGRVGLFSSPRRSRQSWSPPRPRRPGARSSRPAGGGATPAACSAA